MRRHRASVSRAGDARAGVDNLARRKSQLQKKIRARSVRAKNQIVNQPHGTHPGCDKGHRACGHALHGFELQGIDQRQVVQRHQGFFLHNRLHGFQQSLGMDLPRLDERLAAAEAPVQDGGGLTRFRAEQGIAGTERQAVGLTHDGADHQPHVEVEVLHQPADDLDLLKILLSEVGDFRLHQVEQFQDNRGDTAEMAGPIAAFEGLGELARLDKGVKPRGVDILLTRERKSRPRSGRAGSWHPSRGRGGNGQDPRSN